MVIENHYLGAIVDYGQFDSFYHEHPRTYSFTSFLHIANSLNRNLMDAQFVSRYGGNIRVFIGASKPADIIIDESHFSNTLNSMKDSMMSWITNTQKQLMLWFKRRKIGAKAFQVNDNHDKATWFDESKISAVYEIKGSLKVGLYFLVPDSIQRGFSLCRERSNQTHT